jgi:site-specific DNA recombinase
MTDLSNSVLRAIEFLSGFHKDVAKLLGSVEDAARTKGLTPLWGAQSMWDRSSAYYGAAGWMARYLCRAYAPAPADGATVQKLQQRLACFLVYLSRFLFSARWTAFTMAPSRGSGAAAAYVRKSTAQEGVSDEAKSVARQLASVREFATSRGWQMPDGLVFQDDGISGAEFENRDGLQALLRALTPRPPFTHLIMMATDRLGREVWETNYILKRLLQAGVRVWTYLDNTEISAKDKMRQTLTGLIDDEESARSRARTRAVMVGKADRGHVTGGAVFGYRNVEVRTADGKRSHVELQIVPPEADAVRWLFERVTEGWGYRRTAHAANAAGLPTPKPRRRKDDGGRAVAGWSPSTVRDVVHRELYRGLRVWGKRKKRDPWGQRRPTLQPKDAWMIRPAEHLRIVSDDLWARAHERLQTSRESYIRTNDGKLFGKPGNSVESKYLLTGLATCGVCGGALTVRSSKRHPWAYYCLSNIQRGAAVCPTPPTLRCMASIMWC